MKRDSLAAELEKDPQLSSSKRQQRSQAFASNNSYARLERQLLLSQASVTELQNKLKDKDAQIERLEGDRRWFADQEMAERVKNEKENAITAESMRALESENRTLRSSLLSVRKELDELQETYEKNSQSSAQTISSQKSQIASLAHETRIISSELEEAKRLADERQRTIDDIHALSVAVVDETDARSSKLEEDSTRVVQDELRRQTDYLRTLELDNVRMTREVRMLKEKSVSVEVVREEILGLEAKIHMLEASASRAAQLEAELNAVKKERDEWPPAMPSIPQTEALSSLRFAHATLLEQHGTTSALLRQCQAELDDLKQQAVESQELIDALQKKNREAKETLSRKETSYSLAEKEVRFLKALVESYEAEQQAHGGGPNAPDDGLANHVRQLEALVEEYRNELKKLTKDVETGQALSEVAKEQESDVIRDLRDKLNEERVQKEELQKEHIKVSDELETVSQILFELRGEIAGGRHVPPRTRILEMKENPESDWFASRQKLMDNLKAENNALLRRLKDLEESGIAVDDAGKREELMVPRASWEQVSKEKMDLEEVVRQKDKRLVRLKEVFASKTQEFRDILAVILGVKLVFYPNGQVRVTSVFDLCASFVFKLPSLHQGKAKKKEEADDDGRMQLVAHGEGGPQDLPNLVRYWIDGEQCIPGFLASVTLECYEIAKIKREKDVEMQEVNAAV